MAEDKEVDDQEAEYRRRLDERYQEAREDLHASKGWRGWKSLTSHQRVVWVVGVVIVVMLAVGLVRMVMG